MNKYKLGIMSSTWWITAPTLDIAVVTLRLATETTAPIVCYSTNEQSTFMHMVDLRKFENYCAANTTLLVEAFKTLTVIE
jgi:hypothetical protein